MHETKCFVAIEIPTRGRVRHQGLQEQCWSMPAWEDFLGTICLWQAWRDTGVPESRPSSVLSARMDLPAQKSRQRFPLAGFKIRKVKLATSSCRLTEYFWTGAYNAWYDSLGTTDPACNGSIHASRLVEWPLQLTLHNIPFMKQFQQSNPGSQKFGCNLQASKGEGQSESSQASA